MRQDDFLYGCRSGLQKAVRRGDLQLTKHCFDALWSNKIHRTWLRWRVVALVQEEVSYYLGELAEFFDKKSEDEKDWRRLFYELILTPKNKDGTALLFLARRHYDKVRHSELSFILPWFKNPMVDPSLIVDDFLKSIFSIRDFSSYEKRALVMLRKRVDMGGMLGDRQNCLSNMVFVAFRPLVKEEVRKVVDESVESYINEFGTSLKEVKELPWYVMDMHTLVGKTAMKIFIKRRGKKFGIKDEEQLSRLWFAFSSGFVPKDKMNYREVCENVSPFDSVWEVLNIKTSIDGIGKRAAKETYQWWKKIVEPEVKSMVEWLLKEREEE